MSEEWLSKVLDKLRVKRADKHNREDLKPCLPKVG